MMEQSPFRQRIAHGALPVGGNSNATAIMIGERAADFIKGNRVVRVFLNGDIVSAK